MSTPDLIMGWLPDTSIREFVDEQREVFAALPFVLISSVDSTVEQIAEMPWAREERAARPGWALSVDPLVISGSDLVRIAGSLFYGFDEIWVPARLPVAAPPSNGMVVGPMRVSEEDLSHDLLVWMHRSECRLGLGDGTGMNFVAPDVQLASRLGLGMGAP